MTATRTPAIRAAALPASANASTGLRISVGTGSPGWSAASEALLDFRFGMAPSATLDPHIIRVPLQPLAAPLAWERWEVGGPCRVALEDGCRLRSSGDYLAIDATVTVAPDTMAGNISRLYQRLVTLARRHGFPHLLRAWNFIPGINDGVGDLVTYVRFNEGRAAAFDELGIQPGLYPAATAVGSAPVEPLVVIMLFSVTAASPMENPRQTHAYLYPRRFGPRPPAFARAVHLPTDAGSCLLISGTASIVGHESRHDSLQAQLDETLANLSSLLGSAGRDTRPDLNVNRSSWRVYLRNPADRGLVEPAVRAALGPIADILYLEAAICRRELLLEIEGYCQMPVVPQPGQDRHA